MLRVAVSLSSHGLGHAVRAAAVLEALGKLVPLRLSVVATCPRRIWPVSLEGSTSAWYAEGCDVGVVQSDDVTVDLAATRAALNGWLRDLPVTLERESARLADGFDLLIGDVPSAAFVAAHRAGIPGVAIANFSWDWIYSELGFHDAAEVAADGYDKASLLLETLPSAPMPAFRRRLDVGLVARPTAPSRVEARGKVEIGHRDSAVLLAFQPASSPSLRLPPARAGRVYLVPTGWPISEPRSDLRALPASMSFLEALAAADVVVGKPGYGLIGDVEAVGARFLYVPRPGFPENSVLEDHLSRRAATRSLGADCLARGDWDELLTDLEHSQRPSVADIGGAARAARAIADLLGIDTAPDPV